MYIKSLISACIVISLVSCNTDQIKTPSPQDAFFEALASHCGKAYQGRVISEDERDSDWRKEVLTMHVRDCTPDIIRIPLHVGENRSRTWVISKTENGLTLKHDHRHEDGSPDAVTQYGGTTNNEGSMTSQNFPADDYSKTLFKEEGLEVSVDNIWTIELIDKTTFAYQLTRPNRFFRAEFDLENTVDLPPAAWGYTE